MFFQKTDIANSLLRHGRDVCPTWVGRCVPCVTLVSMKGVWCERLRGPKVASRDE